MKINVESISEIEPKLEQRKPSTLNINAHLTLGQMENLFYEMWDDVGTDIIVGWMKKEDVNLRDKL